jgi:hypothetical protein
MKKIVETVGKWLLGLLLWFGVPGLLAMCGAVATLFLFLGAVAVDSMALRVAALDTMCGVYAGEAFDLCAASPWFRILVLIVAFAIGAGLYYGFFLFKDIANLTPAATAPGDGDGNPHRVADDSADPRWRMLRMAAHIAWLRSKFPQTLEEHEAYLSTGDNAIIDDYTLIWTETWSRWKAEKPPRRPPCDHAPAHPGQKRLDPDE